MESPPHEIDAVARAKMNTQLADAVSDRLHVAGVAMRQTRNAPQNFDPRLAISQGAEPLCESVGLLDLDHRGTYTVVYDPSTGPPVQEAAP